MSLGNKNLVINMLNELQGVSIDSPTAERLTSVMASVNETFLPLEKDSFFDTEPAHFDRLLRKLANGDEGENDG